MGINKHVLLISYYFPPLGMGGVGRAHALFKFLPKYGYDVTVLTVKPVDYHHYDYSALKAGDENKITRSGSIDPSRVMYLLGMRRASHSLKFKHTVSFFNFPDSKRGWNLFAHGKAKKIISEKDISAVITTSPPPSSHLLGLRLKKIYDIPWLADFRDFWFSLPIEMIYPTQFQKSYAWNIKNKIIRTADEIICVNGSIRKYLGRGEVITNGADPATADLWKNDEPGKSGKFVIGVLGTINNLTPIEPLFKVVAEIIKKNHTIKDKFEILHVGSFDSSERNSLLEKYSLKNVVTCRGYLSHHEAIKVLAVADILYFSVNDFGKYHILPGRLFDYLTSGKPVIGIAPSGSDAEMLINNYSRGKAILHNQTEALIDFIMKHFETNEAGSIKNSESNSHQYSTLHMAEKFAGILDKVVA